MKQKYKNIITLVTVLTLQFIAMVIFAMFLWDGVEKRADVFYQQGVEDAQENCVEYLFYSWNFSGDFPQPTTIFYNLSPEVQTIS